MKRLNRQRGFSLIELLVVMAVILTLLGILLPSLQGVKERAYMVVCANNLRQLGIAFTAYLADNDGYYPGTGPCNGWGAQRDNYIRWGGCGSAGSYDNTSAIFPYLGQVTRGTNDYPDVLVCPVDSKALSGINRPGLSYPMNVEFQNDDSPASSINRRDIRDGAMSRYILLVEQDLTGNDDSHLHTRTVGGGATGQFEDGGGYMGSRHFGKAACLYADGHVEFHSGSAGGSSGSCSCCGRCPPDPSTCSCSGGSAGSGGTIDPFNYCGTAGDVRCPFAPMADPATSTTWYH